MNIVAVVDYGMCNLDSIARAVEECGGRAIITNQKRDLERSNRIILPGVGAFPEAMENLKRLELDQALSEQVIGKGIPLLGICLGMQLLANRGWEIRETQGLGWIAGEVKKIEPTKEDFRIPHTGWDEVNLQKDNFLFTGILSGKDFYFNHSYRFCPDRERDIVAYTPYGCGFVSAVHKENVVGVQFHPEKSQKLGLKVLKNFLEM